MPVTNNGCSIRVHADTTDCRPNDSKTQEIELGMFQKQVSEQFNDLSSVRGDELLSFSWVHYLLDVFIRCSDEFRIILSNNTCYLSKPPTDRLIGEFYDQNVKALDVCNAIRDGIEQVRRWEKSLEIIICALDGKKTLGKGQIRRAKKALIDLLIKMLDEKESNSSLAHRNKSFGRNNGSNKDLKNLGHFRSLSWSVSMSWSASRQIQATEIISTNGLSVAVYTMSNVLLLVMSVLMAAIPCQDRGFQTYFSIPKQCVWLSSIMSIHERISEESKKERKGKDACGLLKEVFETKKQTRQMNEMLDSLEFPLSKEKEIEVREKVEKLKRVYKTLKDGLCPLERRVREVFHRIVQSQREGLDSFRAGTK